MGQPTPGIPVYKVECVTGGRTRILHRNLLLPLQGKIRQPGGLEVENLPSPDEEEDEEGGMPWVTRAPQVRARRRVTPPQSSPTQPVKVTGKDALADLKSKDPSDFRQLSGQLDDESSEEEELYTNSLTCHTTASDSTTIGICLLLWALQHPEWKSPVQLVKLKASSVPVCPILRMLPNLIILVPVVVLVQETVYLLVIQMIPNLKVK